MTETKGESVPGNVILPGRCDFCQIRNAQYTVNGGLWWICESCMKQEYGGEEE